jgi:outer membrane protein assembly factor BamB
MASEPGWPQFRGPTGDGQWPGQEAPPTYWSETSNIVWKTELPHRGWSTPAILNGQVWVTTATIEGNDFFVYCLDAGSGRTLHKARLFHSDAPEPLGNTVNSYATPSAAIEDGRVYLHFGSYGTACLDTRTFEVLWKRQDLPCRHYRGPSSSPVLHKDLLVLTFDGVDQQYLAALRKSTGETVWRTDRSVPWNDENVPGQMAKDGDLRKAHSTPLITAIGGRDVLLSPGAKAAYAYDAANGKEIWRVRHECWSASPVMLYEDGLAFFITGFGKTETIAARANGAGDVTETHVAWRNGSVAPRTASPILVGGRLYMASDDGVLTGVEAKTGEQVWRHRMGGAVASSPIHAGGRLYFCNQQGLTTVVAPGLKPEIVATNRLDMGTMASPAVYGGSLFLRTKTHLYRIGKP